MVPYVEDWKAFIANTIASVKSGEIPQARIDDAVLRHMATRHIAGTRWSSKRYLNMELLKQRNAMIA